jgi:hypothetical protein
MDRIQRRARREGRAGDMLCHDRAARVRAGAHAAVADHRYPIR